MGRVIASLVSLFCLLAVPVLGQAINSLNFDHWYDPLAEVIVQLNPVIQNDSVAVYVRMKTNNAVATRYMLKWEKRDSFAQRQGTPIAKADTIQLSPAWGAKKLVFPKPVKPWLLVVKVTNLATGKYLYYFRQIESHYPVNGYLEKDGVKQWDNYVTAENVYRIRGSGSAKPITISYYRDNFPSPSPPFVVKELKMDRFLFPDSVFTVPAGGAIGPFTREGLYLAQEDTLSERGFSFFVKRQPYPRYNKLADLKGPLLFVTTQQENDALGKAGEDKASFDRIILDITKDKDKARNFMRTYFRRIELANTFFTSFKEGWKTDRGMVFAIFGKPDEVRMDSGYEDWSYKNPQLIFRFAHAGSVYHPGHSVLIRDKDYTEFWYTAIDLWRKSRY